MWGGQQRCIHHKKKDNYWRTLICKLKWIFLGLMIWTVNRLKMTKYLKCEKKRKEQRLSQMHFDGTHQTQWWSRRSTQTPQIRQWPALGGRTTLQVVHQFLLPLCSGSTPACSEGPVRLAVATVASCLAPSMPVSLSARAPSHLTEQPAGFRLSSTTPGSCLVWTSATRVSTTPTVTMVTWIRLIFPTGSTSVMNK